MYPLPANAKRIRYLESTGTEYIDTGVAGSTPLRVKIKFSISPNGSSNNSLFGAFSTNNRLAIYIYKLSNGKNRIRLGCGTKSNAEIGLDAADDEVHEIVINFEADNLWAEVDGGTRVSISGATAATNSTNAFIFNRSGTTNPIKARVYSASIWTGSSMSLVRDFVPCRIGQTGYLFDRASGELFGNDGSDDFVLGQDTFQQGVLPTRMMVGGVRKEGPAPGIYVTFDNVSSSYAGLTNYSDTIRFDLTPTTNQMGWDFWLREGQTLPSSPGDVNGISICDPATGGSLIMIWNDTQDFASISGIDTSSPTVNLYSVESGTITIRKVT